MDRENVRATWIKRTMCWILMSVVGPIVFMSEGEGLGLFSILHSTRTACASACIFEGRGAGCVWGIQWAMLWCREDWGDNDGE